MAELSVEHTIGGTIPRVRIFLCTQTLITETITDTHIEDGVQVRRVVNLPNVLQLQLWLMVFVAGRSLAHTILAKTVSWVIAILMTRLHVLLYVLPTLDSQTIVARTLVVPLRSTKSCEREQVLGTKLLGYTGKIVISFKFCTLDITITPSFTTQKGKTPVTSHLTGTYRKQNLVVTIVTDTIAGKTTALRICCLGNDIDRTTDRRSRHFGSTQTTLGLNTAGHIGQTCPVAPINTTPLHIVHRNAIDQHRIVFRLETTDVDFGITETTTVTTDINTRSRLQNLGEVGRTHTFFNIRLRNGRQSNRCFACNRTGGHHSVLQFHSIHFEQDIAQMNALSLFSHRVTEGLVTQIAKSKYTTGLSHLQGEATVIVGLHHFLTTTDADGSTYQRFTRLSVDHVSGYDNLCHSGIYSQKSKHCEQKERDHLFSHNLILFVILLITKAKLTITFVLYVTNLQIFDNSKQYS
ncbi:hypothetical protein EVA_03998 [gut metagenome]|uniref:Uncharacterized protein n=1 Tax=gut metagenome TaxID=749906 RepID=J9D5A0_9ZZZZ